MNDRVTELEAEARLLLESDRVTAPTRRAMLERLGPAGHAQGVLSSRQREALAAVAARLVPLGDLSARVELALRFDVELAQGLGDGWRYAGLPPDALAIADGLDALDRAAGAGGFMGREPSDQDALLQRAQSESLSDWPFSSARWFVEVLARLARLAYSHPLVQLDIGYDGMADAHGFQDLDAPSS